jgi:hypothetical protein
MLKMIGTFTSDTLARAVDSCLDLVTVSHRRVSVGIDCPPCARIERSILDSSPKKIAASLLADRGIEVTCLDFGLRETSPGYYIFTMDPALSHQGVSRRALHWVFERDRKP